MLLDGAPLVLECDLLAENYVCSRQQKAYLTKNRTRNTRYPDLPKYERPKICSSKASEFHENIGQLTEKSLCKPRAKLYVQVDETTGRLGRE